MSTWFDELIQRFLDYLEGHRMSDDSDLITFISVQLRKERKIRELEEDKNKEIEQ